MTTGLDGLRERARAFADRLWLAAGSNPTVLAYAWDAQIVDDLLTALSAGPQGAEGPAKAPLVAELRQLSTLPTKVTQLARGTLFEDVANALEAFGTLYKADMEYDRCSAALLRAQADNAARGNQTNPAKEQRDATKAAINRKNALREIKWTA